MFSQAKIGQILREIEEKIGCRSDTLSGDDKEILDLAENLREGVPMATPVYDGAK